jgi:hypothetical protein
LLLEAQSCTGVSCRRGVGVTGLKLVAAKREKRELGELTTADVVDMESYWIARVANEHRVPIIIIRSVSDAMNDVLPELPSWQSIDTIPYFLTHPCRGFNLYRSMLRARKNMTTFINCVIEAAA